MSNKVIINLVLIAAIAGVVWFGSNIKPAPKPGPKPDDDQGEVIIDGKLPSYADVTAINLAATKKHLAYKAVGNSHLISEYKKGSFKSTDAFITMSRDIEMKAREKAFTDKHSGFSVAELDAEFIEKNWKNTEVVVKYLEAQKAAWEKLAK